MIHLEKKCKVGGLGLKVSANLSEAQETCVMEVKWDNFLPEIIRDAVQLPYGRTGSFSKYEACREPMVAPGVLSYT